MSVATTSTFIRPQLHFTPPHGWMNDPNGLVYHRGEYHLFYQHYPDDIVWGPMHWGHAISQDLLTWEHHPIALYPDGDGFIFSGSAVVDHHNTAGFGAKAMVAIYTVHHWTEHEGQSDQTQNQAIAFSLDNGRTWTKYASNPVITMPSDLGHQDFRDPKVFWYGTPQDGHWVMILAVYDETWLYTSPDLKRWEKASAFGRDYGCHGSVWECPDLIEIEFNGTTEKSWVLIVSVQDGAPAGGNGVQYFVGDFDGHTFTPHDAPDVTRWLDYGPDFYAAVTWDNEPSGRHLLIGWMNNWAYGNSTPADRWRGMMSLPRELYLARQGDQIEVYSRPVAELTDLLVRDDLSACPFVLKEGEHLLAEAHEVTAVAELEFFLDANTAATRFGLIIRGEDGEYGRVAYDTTKEVCQVSRTMIGHDVAKMVEDFPFEVEASSVDGRLSWQLVLDHHSLELFINGGSRVISQQWVINRPQVELSLFVEGGDVPVTFKLHQLAPRSLD